jgi:hypothetical protein
MKKIATFLLGSVLAALSAQAEVLFMDSTNYPYTNGCIEGQGQWYCYYPATPYLDALVTNNVLLLNTTNHDAVATPTNGWLNPTVYYTYASFSINVSQLPSTANGGYFCQFQNDNDTNDCCHLFIDTHDTVVPGTFRLGIANYDTTFSTVIPPHNYPLDLATGVTYTVVMLFDNSGDPTDPLLGATLWINPSVQDYDNALNEDYVSPGIGNGFAYGLDTTGSPNLLAIIVSQIGFSPYANAGISNVVAATTFAEVNTTNPPAIGIPPQSGTNYSGNSTMLYVVASGVDLTYQWYSQTSGALSDSSGNFTGSTSNILVINNLTASDTYYVVVTDAYGNSATSTTALETVITTPTAPFFPPSQPGQASTGGINVTNNLFTSAGFTNLAEGTGPLSYQWYFAPTNLPIAFAPLAGQTGPILAISELAYADAGYYYVQASDAVAGGSVTDGPTNSLTVLPPLVATLPQLHELMGTLVTNITGGNQVTVNSNGITVSGYVTTFGPLTVSTKTYAEFYIGYQNSGIYVYWGDAGTNGVPAPGTFVTVTGPCEVYDGQLEIDPGANGVVVSNAVPVQMPNPQPANFALLATNALSPYGVQIQCALVTFTNIYIYGSKTGGTIGNGGIFYSNGYTKLYMTEGPYSSPQNTNYITLYVPAYGFGGISTNIWYKPVPKYAYQLSGIMADFDGASELDVTRLQDFVTNAPAAFTNSVTLGKKGVLTMNWPVQTGSTYTVYSASNLLGLWTQIAYGLSYYPTNGTFSVTNTVSEQFYRISTP